MASSDTPEAARVTVTVFMVLRPQRFSNPQANASHQWAVRLLSYSYRCVSAMIFRHFYA